MVVLLVSVIETRLLHHFSVLLWTLAPGLHENGEFVVDLPMGIGIDFAHILYL